MWEIAIIEDKIIIEGDSWGRVDVVDPGNIYLPIFWDVEHGAGTAAYRSSSGAIFLIPPSDVAAVEELSVLAGIAGLSKLDVNDILVDIVIEA